MNHQLGQVEETNDQYHAGPGISKSHLDTIHGASPAHYWHKYLNPNREPEEQTLAYILGNAIHAAILEPDTLLDRYIADPGISRRSNAGKAEWADFVAQHPHHMVLPDEGMKLVLGVRDAALRHPLASMLIQGGEAEQSHYAIDQETGELIKCRVDYLKPGLIVDIKSTADASPTAFAKSCANYRYPHQVAWYQHVLRSQYGEAPQAWAFMAVEKTPPYAIGVYYLPERDIDLAYDACRADLLRIVECKSTGHFPDYADEPRELAMPPWWRP